MKIGITMFPTDYTIPPHELAIECEARGFESLWLPEHSHIPASRRSPYPGGGDLPKPYYDSYDPFVSLGAAAVVTKNIKLGTGICLVIERDPIHTAKEVSTVDRLSNGRFIFGVGGGWNAEEMENHGTVFATRFKLMRERVMAMKELWTKSKAAYSGEFVKIEESMQWPKPVQKPHPPILVGGAFPHAAKRAIAYGDGWIPVGGRFDVLEILPKFREMTKEAGRDPKTVSFDVFGGPRDPELAQRFADAGVDRLVIMLGSRDRDATLPVLDQSAKLIAACARG
jgi:probable F420-dependent oxidoreductase